MPLLIGSQLLFLSFTAGLGGGDLPHEGLENDRKNSPLLENTLQ